MLIPGFCCNPNHNSLISSYHVCEPTRPRCSGCQENPQTNSCWEWWPIPSPANLPREQSQQEQHSQVRTAQPWGVWHAPEHPAIFLCLHCQGHTGEHTQLGEGRFGTEILQKTTGAAKPASSAPLKITTYSWIKTPLRFWHPTPFKNLLCHSGGHIKNHIFGGKMPSQKAFPAAPRAQESRACEHRA